MRNKIDIKFVCQFALDDFKTKYAGSLFGFCWAFIQPIVTIIIYWFIFQIGFKSEPVDGIPFIVWLVTGIVPWFFISDAIVNATTGVVDYKYLVKKVVFNVDILPLTKIISGFFIQVFLLIFAMLLCIIYGSAPNIYWLQLVYYIGYMFVLCTGIAYLTSSLQVFFKDTLQFVSIIIQLLFWLTPIVWRIGIMSETIQKILKMNPFYYIVNGYRDSLIYHKGIISNTLPMLAYYWIIAIILFVAGVRAYEKLKPHFADVL